MKTAKALFLMFIISMVPIPSPCSKKDSDYFRRAKAAAKEFIAISVAFAVEYNVDQEKLLTSLLDGFSKQTQEGYEKTSYVFLKTPVIGNLLNNFLKKSNKTAYKHANPQDYYFLEATLHSASILIPYFMTKKLLDVLW